jgi:hypothetical protein
VVVAQSPKKDVAVSVKQPEKPVVILPGGPKEERVPRRSFGDITASSTFGHAADYSWVSGELQFVHAHNAWRLRYASVDESDRYGGGVTLICTTPMTQFHDGQQVRIEGHVQDSNPRDTTYVVQSIQPLPHM